MHTAAPPRGRKRSELIRPKVLTSDAPHPLDYAKTPFALQIQGSHRCATRTCAPRAAIWIARRCHDDAILDAAARDDGSRNAGHLIPVSIVSPPARPARHTPSVRVEPCATPARLAEDCGLVAGARVSRAAHSEPPSGRPYGSTFPQVASRGDRAGGVPHPGPWKNAGSRTAGWRFLRRRVTPRPAWSTPPGRPYGATPFRRRPRSPGRPLSCRAASPSGCDRSRRQP